MSAETKLFRPKRAEARGSVAEGSPKQLVQTLSGVPAEFFETDIHLSFAVCIFPAPRPYAIGVKLL
jgi:hypothetical protein